MVPNYIDNDEDELLLYVEILKYKTRKNNFRQSRDYSNKFFML